VAAPTALWSLFSAKVDLLGATMMRTSSAAGAASLLAGLAPRFACSASVSRLYPAVGRAAARTGASPATEMVAPGVYAIAETGSVAVDEPANDRGACFLAEHLWLLVPEREIVGTLDLGIERLHALVRNGSHHPLLMSGPSRTADIERVLTIGVHGPRALTIVVVGDS
jgi:L-lactate utilization protein LutC